jgi:hypothetical protein
VSYHQQQKEEGHQDSGDQQLLSGAGMRVVDVLPAGTAGWAAALGNWPGALCANQVFAAHRSSFWPALDVMSGLSCQFPSRLLPGLT